MKRLKVALAIFGLLCVFILNGCSSGGGNSSVSSVGSSLGVKLLNPLPDATDVSSSPSIQIAFTKAVQGVNQRTVTLHQGSAAGQAVSIGQIVVGSNNTYTFSPSAHLSDHTSYCLVLGAKAAEAAAGLGTETRITSISVAEDQLPETTFCFVTGDDPAPTVVPVVPSDSESGISTTPNIQVKFSEEVINVNATNVTLREGSPTGINVPFGDVIAGANNTFTFSPNTTLKQKTTYYVVLGTGITDLTGNSLSEFSFSFTTGDFAAPSVNIISPSNNATGISTSLSIQLQFSKEVSNVNATNVTLHEGSPTGTNISMSGITAGSNNTFTFSPGTVLNQQTTYYVVLDTGIKDTAGIPLTAINFTFTTGDFKSPTAGIISPGNNATGISANPSIQLQFSEAVNNVNPTNVTLHEGSPTGTTIAIGMIIAGSNNTFTFSPDTTLNQQTTYYVVLGAGINDIAGNPLTPANFSFTTGDFTAPAVNIISPSNNATGISVSPSIQLKFSKTVINVTAANITLHKDSPTGAVVSISSIISGTDNTFTFSPVAALNEKTTYYVVLSNRITDVYGNSLLPATFSFTTGDFTAPTVSMVSPGNNSLSVSTTPNIQVRFSEAINNINATNITLYEGSVAGPIIPIGAITAGADNTYTFNPATTLKLQTQYYLVFSDGITDMVGYHLTPTTFNFTTAGMLTCWGYDYYDPLKITPLLDHPSSVSVGSTNICVIDATGVVCWGDNSYNQNYSPKVDNPIKISTSEQYACVIDQTASGNKLYCWGEPAYDRTSVPLLANPTDVSTQTYNVCAIDSANSGNKVYCWGYANYGVNSVPPLENPIAISVDLEYACAIDSTKSGNKVVCWGNQPTLPILENPTMISSGPSHTCAIDSTKNGNKVVCWGDNQDGKATVPSTLVNPTTISAGVETTCALDSTGLKCWGNQSLGGNVPSSLKNVVSVSAGALRTCAISRDSLGGY